ncbi:MAG: hypothetical protein JWN39_592 [Ilumatobacteraceae bacterium]|nr:hypothetical protein [Ilumatobacteraceae bacterium]
MWRRRMVVMALVSASVVVPVLWAQTGSAADPVVQTFHGLTPARLLDTRAGQSTIDGQSLGGGAVGPAATIDVPVLGRGGVPVSGVGSVALNITVAGPTSSGFVTAYATAQDRPTASNLNFTPGLVVANMAIVAIGDGGQIELYNSGGNTDLVVDVLGWFPSGASYKGLNPARLLDTRPGQPTIDDQFETGTPVAGGTSIDLPVLGRGGLPSTKVGSVALNVTVAGATAGGFVTVFPTGGARPTASNLNFVAGQVVPNMVIVPVGANGQITLYNSNGSTDLAVDVLGWFPTGTSYTGLNPARLLDTRSGQPTVDAQYQGVGAAATAGQIDVPMLGRGGVPASGVGAVALNVTAAGPTSSTYITVFPTGAGRPTASNINLTPGATVPNMVIVKVGTGGMVSLFNQSGNTDLIVDVLGWFPLDSTDGGGSGTTGPGGSSTTAPGGTTTTPTSTTTVPVPGPTELVSLANTAPPGNGDSTAPAVSGDGRYVAFASDATNLLSGADGNGKTDVFLRDRQSGTTTRLSVSTGGVAGNGNSDSPAISFDGKFVVFRSFATNLVSPATDGAGDIFMRDIAGGKTFEVSVAVGSTTDGNGVSSQPTISGDGTVVAFRSTATNLGLGHTTGHTDIYRMNISGVTVPSGKWVTTQVNAGATGDASQPSLSFDGSAVAFTSAAANLVPNDTNTATDVFRFRSGAVLRVSKTNNNGQANGNSSSPSISGDGNLVAYQSDATNLAPGLDFDTKTDIFVADIDVDVLNDTLYVSYARNGNASNGDSLTPSISRDGQTIAFASDSSNLVAGDGNTVRDIFVGSIASGGQPTFRASVGTGAVQANGASHNAAISPNGRYVAFDSAATNIGTDGNATADVFIRDDGA